MNRTLKFPILVLGALTFSCSGSDTGPITPQKDAIEFETSSLPGGQQGESYSAEIFAKGGSGEDYRWAVVGSLPPGLFMSSKGMIVDQSAKRLMTTILGTPSSNGTFTFSIRLTDGDGDFESVEMTIEIDPPPPALAISTETLPDGGTETPYTAQLEATNGVEPYRWVLTGGSLPPGITMADSGAISGMPGDAGPFQFQVRVLDADNKSAEGMFTIAVQDESLPLEMVTTDLPDGEVGIAFSTEIEAKNGAVGYTWQLFGDAPPGLTITPEGNPATLSGTPTDRGSYTFQVEVEDADGARVRRTFFVEIIPARPPIRIVTLELPGGEVAQAYDGVITAVNGSGMGFTWSVAQGSLPPGLTLSPTGTPDGTITGAPTTSGTFNFTIQVADDRGQTHEASYMVTIIPQIFPIEIVATSSTPGGPPTPIRLPNTRLGEQYSTTLTARNGFGNYNWVIERGRLPAGLDLEVSGTPSTRIIGLAGERGTFTATITVYDSNNQTATQVFSLFVGGPEFPVNMVSTAVTDGLSCNPYNVDIVAQQGSNVDYAWAVTQGSLPPGLILDPTGTPATKLRGFPTAAAAGNYTFTITVTDSAGDTSSRQFSMNVTDNGTGQRWLAMVGDGFIDNRFDIMVSDICAAVPSTAVQASPPGTTGDADTGSTDFALSPDGRYVAFIGDFRVVGFDEVWVADITTPTPSAPVIVSPAQASSSLYDAYDLKWGPNGNRLAFLGDFNVNGRNEVYVVDTSAGLVANSAVPAMPTSMPSFADVDSTDYWFSRGGSYLAIKADTFSSSAYELWVADLTTVTANNAVRVSDPLPSTSVDVNEPIFWASDTQVMYNGDFNVTFQDEMWLVDMADVVRAPRRLNPTFPTSSGDCWFGTGRYGVTGDGNYAWWTSDLRQTFGSYELYAVDLNNPTAVGQMVHPPMAATSNDFWYGESPLTGSKVAMVGPALIAGVYELFVFDLSQPYPQALATARANGPMQPNGDIFNYTDIEWSPDGNFVAYTGDQDDEGHDAAYVVNVSSQPFAEAVRVSDPMVTSSAMDAFNMYWAPDSSKVAFQGDLRLSSVNECLVSDVSSGTPMPGVFVNSAISGSQDVDIPFIFKSDGSGIFYRSDATVAFQDEVWFVDLSSPTPATPVRVSPPVPTNGDIFYITGQ